jgi:hypothetical protein
MITNPRDFCTLCLKLRYKHFKHENHREELQRATHINITECESFKTTIVNGGAVFVEFLYVEAYLPRTYFSLPKMGKLHIFQNIQLHRIKRKFVFSFYLLIASRCFFQLSAVLVILLNSASKKRASLNFLYFGILGWIYINNWRLCVQETQILDDPQLICMGWQNTHLSWWNWLKEKFTDTGI